MFVNVLVLIDLSAAFDNIDYNILTSRLEGLRNGGVSLEAPWTCCMFKSTALSYGFFTGIFFGLYIICTAKRLVSVLQTAWLPRLLRVLLSLLLRVLPRVLPRVPFFSYAV